MKKHIIIFLILLVILSVLVFVTLFLDYNSNIAIQTKELKETQVALEGAKQDLHALLNEADRYLYDIDIINRYSEEYNVPIEVIMAVIKMESSFDVNATSGSSHGLMQINNVHLKHLEDKMEILQIDRNIECGVSLLSGLKEQKDDLHYILNSYNMGQYGYKDFVKQTGEIARSYSRNGIKIIQDLKD